MTLARESKATQEANNLIMFQAYPFHSSTYVSSAGAPPLHPSSLYLGNTFEAQIPFAVTDPTELSNCTDLVMGGSSSSSSEDLEGLGAMLSFTPGDNHSYNRTPWAYPCNSPLIFEQGGGVGDHFSSSIPVESFRLFSSGDSFFRGEEKERERSLCLQHKRPYPGEEIKVQASKRVCGYSKAMDVDMDMDMDMGGDCIPSLLFRKPTKQRHVPSKDPQSIAAKNRRERISERLKILQDLVPNGTKVDLVTMLEKAISYVKFLQLQVKVLATDEFWPAQGGQAPEVGQVKEAIEAILSSHNSKASSSSPSNPTM
ncbi:hypothetical protein AMTRI_Chr04g179820 [Amborella trichopoda]